MKHYSIRFALVTFFVSVFFAGIAYADTKVYDFSDSSQYKYASSVLIKDNKARLIPYYDSSAIVTSGTLLLENYENSNVSDGSSGMLTYEDGKFGKGLRVNNGGKINYNSANRISPSSGTIEFWFKPNSVASPFELFNCSESGQNWTKVADFTDSPGNLGGVQAIEEFKGRVYATVGGGYDYATRVYRSDSDGVNWDTSIADIGTGYARGLTAYDSPPGTSKLYVVEEHWAGNYGTGRVYSTSDGVSYGEVVALNSNGLFYPPDGDGAGYRSSVAYNGKLFCGTRGNYFGTSIYNGASNDTKLTRNLDENYLIWDGRDPNGNVVESGPYIYIIQTTEFKKDGVITIVK